MKLKTIAILIILLASSLATVVAIGDNEQVTEKLPEPAKLSLFPVSSELDNMIDSASYVAQARKSRLSNRLSSEAIVENNIIVKPMLTQQDFSFKLTSAGTVQPTINQFVLKGTADDDFWDNETVIFIREGYANRTYTTGDLGEIIIDDIIYTEADIGSFNYTIYFAGAPPILPGFPQTRPEQYVATGVIKITADVVLKTLNKLPDTPQLTPGSSYTYEYSLAFSFGTPFVPSTFNLQNEFNRDINTTGIQGFFNETYTNDLGNKDPLIDTSTAIFEQTVNFVGDTVTISSNAGLQTIRTRIKLDFSLLGINPEIENYITFTSKQNTLDPVYTVIVDYVFTTRYYVLAKEITTVNQAEETFFLNGTNLVINGTLSNSVVNQTLLENIDVGISIQYQPKTGGTAKQIKLLKTGVNGTFQYLLNLNNTYFEFVNSPLTITVRLDPNDLLATTQLQDMTTADKTSTRTIQFRTQITNITVADIPLTNTSFFSENSNFAFSGKLSYDNNASRNVEGISIFVTIAGGSSFVNLTTTVQSDGTFSRNVPSSVLSNLDASKGTFSIYAWVGEVKGANKRYYNAANITSIIQKFNISTSVNLDILTSFVNGVFNGLNTVDIQNTSMYAAFSPLNANYTLNITDQVSRAPLGFYIQLRERVFQKNGNLFNETVYVFKITDSTVNNYIFFITAFSRILLAVGNNAAINNPFIYAGSIFEYQFNVLDRNNQTVTSAGSPTERFKLYGPDNKAPELDLNTITQQDPAELPVDVKVGVNITTTTRFDNIKNVTIYWRYSENNFVDLEVNATFTSAFNISLMVYNSTTGLFEFTIPFRGLEDHGRWVEYYFIVYDLAGQGLDANGNTVNPGTYTYPDPTFSNFTSYIANARKFKLGDSTPPTINGAPISQSTSFGQNVFVCQEGVCVALENFNGEIGLNANVTIEVRGVTDPNSIQNVTLIYTYRHYFPVNGTFSSNTTLRVLMLFDSLTGYYYFDFNSSFFDYNLELDFEVLVVDSLGNTDSSVKASSIVPNSFALGVLDKVAPVIEGTEIPIVDNGIDPRTTREGVTQNPPDYEFFSNETLRITINVTDFGGLGVKNITIFWSYLDVNGTVIQNGNFSTTYDFGTTQAVFTYNFTGYSVNQTIVYSFRISDWGDNSINQNGAYTFKIVDFPEPPPDVTTTQITSVGTDGNTTIIDTVISVNSTLVTTATEEQPNNSLTILIAFIVVFVIMVFVNRFNSIMDYYKRYRRQSTVRSSMESRIDLIRKYGTEGEYRKAVLEIWKATQTLGAEGLQAPQRYNQTVRDYIDILERVSSIERDMLETLAFTFEKAKYGQEQITADDYKDAIEALNVAIETVIALGIRSQIDDEDDWSELDFDDEE